MFTSENQLRAKKRSMSMVLGMMLTFFVSAFSFAQVTTNSGSGLNASYPDLATAITALNGATITSPVVITLAGNETAPAGGYVITAVGTSVNTITITGSASTITASGALTAGNLNDAIFKLVGSDYVTIQNFTMLENAANTTTTAASNNMTEWGVALLYASVTDGCQNITVQNNTIDLNRTYQNTFGIYANATHTAAAPTTSATATGVTGGNHGLKIYGNQITDVNMGIVVVGPTAATDHNDGVDIGGVALATGNTITNYGTTGTFSGYANVSGTVNGILVRNTKNFNISFNTVTSSNGGVTAGTLRGIFIPSFNNAPTGTFTNNILNNNISVRSANASGSILGVHNDATTASATATLNINNNDFNTSGHTVAGTGTITFIQNAVTAGTLSISGNTFTNMSVNTTATTYLINNNCSTNNFTVNNNSVVGSFSKTGAGGIMYGYYNFGSPTGGTAVVSNNNFSNISVTGATNFYGIRQYTTVAQIENVINNVVSNITGGTSGIFGISHGYGAAGSTVSGNLVHTMSSGAAINGINIGDTTAGTVDCYNNTVYGLTTTGGNTVSGISVATSVTCNVYKNKVYNLEANNATGTVNGILVSAGTTNNIYNNIVGDLRTPIANAANPLNGINIAGGTTANVYYNTVMLNASSAGALFGSSAVFANSTPTVTLRNNIFVNNSTVAGAGLAAVYRRSSTTLTSYGSASNNNLFYGSTIFTDGTNTDATLTAYKTRVSTRDASSITENPTFVSTVGSNGQFLHINTATPTLIEGAAVAIATFTDDFDGDVRNGVTPDIGADEFAGIPIAVVVINSISPNPIVNQCTAVSRMVTANITAGGNDITSVSLNYSFNGVPQTPIAMTGGNLTAGTTSDFTGLIPAAVPVNATVTWSVTAVDPLTSKNSAGNTYQDEPLFGSTATANASVMTICNSGSSVLSATLTNIGTKTLGAGASATTSSGTSATNYVSPFTHYYGGYKAQYIIRASELSAAGFGAGSSLTSLAFDVTAAGTTYNGFTVSMGATATNSLTTTFDTTPLTQVYNGNLNVAATGILTLPFGTGGGASSFVWDGTSNILINLCWSNANTGGTAAEVRYDATSFVAMAYYRADSATQAAICAQATATNTQSNRPKMVFGGNFATSITAYSWSDGSTVVGTGNNLSVSPTVTTTYTATLTAAGCTIATNSVTVTVNVTAQPTASAQTFCNSAIVADLVATGTAIQWYAGPSGGSALASTTALATGTYYVTQTIAGCESTRLAVSVTVNVTAQPTASSQTFCNTATVADLAATGTTIQWYSGPSGGSALALTDALATGTYYVTQTIAGCESPRLAVSVTVNVTAQPTASSQTFCNSATVADLVATGTAIQWYAGPSGGSALASTTALATGTYYVTQTIAGCESPRLSVSVTVNVVAAPTGSTTQVISVPVPTDATIEDIVVVGSNIIWYPSAADAVAGTNALPAGTILITGSTYYATQTVGGCTSATSLGVTVTVTLGTSDFDTAAFKVYPNPVTDILNVSYSENISDIEVYNTIGQQVMVKTVNQMNATVDMSGLAGGTYFVKVRVDNAVKTVKVIKK
ncbi:beta strand repeat-containing protein [Flavobacterium pedocola]